MTITNENPYVDQPVDLTKHDQAERPEPTDQPQDQEEQEVSPTFLATTRATVTAHLQRAGRRTWAWICADAYTAEDWNERALAQRTKARADKLRQLQQEATACQQQLRDAVRNAATPGHRADIGSDADDDRFDHPTRRYAGARQDPHIAHLRERLAELRERINDEQAQASATDDLPPTTAELRKARLAVQGQRAAMVVGGVVGIEVLLPMQSPAWLFASLPALAVALWRLGLRGESDDQNQSQAEDPAPAADVPGQRETEAEVAGPGFAAAVAAARQAADTATSPGSAAAAQVVAAAERAAQFQGEADLVAAFFRAGIISASEQAETHLCGAIRADGPGWTATVELPEGKPAELAIGRAAQLASALRVKVSQLYLSKDSSDQGHEGRLIMWVSNVPNPFAGAPIASELIAAESWDFWTQPIPLGPDARALRRTLTLIWKSLMIGGLQGYGKTYLARLIASAAVLDPYVDIVLISGKAGADWAALKLVAREYIVGNSPAVIREMHRVMERLISEMSEHGEYLEKLFESDPATCPEGKVTPLLSKRDGLHITLLIVDELQEILDGAAGLKLAASDDGLDDEGSGKGSRGQSGKPVMVSLFARFVRVARAVCGMGVFITQRPDAESVPTALREVCAKRACYRVKGQGSSKMVLGDDAVDAGAAPHLLTDTQLGVFVLDEGGEEGHLVMRGDVIDLEQFRVICERGRSLRIKAGTLLGQAADRWERERDEIQRRQVITDAIAAMDAHQVDKARLVVLAAWMGELSPEFWDGMTDVDLGARLRAAGAGNTVRIGSVDGVAKASGYTRQQLAEALKSPVL